MGEEARRKIENYSISKAVDGVIAALERVRSKRHGHS